MSPEKEAEESENRFAAYVAQLPALSTTAEVWC
jgi:hypothetical protein